MAAWLAANCVADDILESMPLEMGILALEETISMLQRSKKHSEFVYSVFVGHSANCD